MGNDEQPSGRFVDAIAGIAAHVQNPRVSKDFITELQATLLQFHQHLGKMPVYQEILAKAANMAFGAQFTDSTVQMTYLNHPGLPRIDRIEAQLHSFEKSIKFLCEEHAGEASSLGERREVEKINGFFTDDTDRFCQYFAEKIVQPAISAPQR